MLQCNTLSLRGIQFRNIECCPDFILKGISVSLSVGKSLHIVDSVIEVRRISIGILVCARSQLLHFLQVLWNRSSRMSVCIPWPSLVLPYLSGTVTDKAIVKKSVPVLGTRHVNIT